jgi:tRNA pseudouridine55 synthase
MNALFVAKKPIFVSSNNYVVGLRNRYMAQKAGFSGTLDPFACGTLIVAFGSYTKLFRFLKKTPKRYRAVAWIGASSPSFDMENIQSIEIKEKISVDRIKAELESFKGEVEFTPPKYSAKRIKGKKAYELLRENKEFELKSTKMEVFDISLVHYNHPFITFDVSVSEGGYIRSLAEILSNRLNIPITLSYLERLSEGLFHFDSHKFLNPLDYLDMKKNNYFADMEDFLLGRKLDLKNFELQDDGFYFVNSDKFLSIIEIENQKVKYILNKVELC